MSDAARFALFAALTCGLLAYGACDVVGPIMGLDCQFWVCTCTCPFCGIYSCYTDCDPEGRCSSNSVPIDRDGYKDQAGAYVVYGPTHCGFDNNPISGTWVGADPGRGEKRVAEGVQERTPTPRTPRREPLNALRCSAPAGYCAAGGGCQVTYYPQCSCLCPQSKPAPAGKDAGLQLRTLRVCVGLVPADCSPACSTSLVRAIVQDASVPAVPAPLGSYARHVLRARRGL